MADRASSQKARAAAVIAVALAIVLGILLLRINGPAPKPANAPGNEFSAYRALDAERATIGGKTPHPMGSAANQTVRARIVSRLQSLGYEAEVQRAFVCNAHNDCATVENIIAQAPGQPPGSSVVLCAHYDSVAAGPGASDDGTGVAALLEIARAIRTEKFRNPVTFLIDDGEEAGLLGAEAFVADKSRSEPVGAVINLEARGTAGPSVMFETSTNNRWFIPIVTRALPNPVTTSLFFSIYELLPNDTDLTVFKRAGMTGVNFGYVKNVAWYHTPFDDIDHVNLRSLQHHGENGLASLRALANTDLHRRSTGNAVWFDILGFFVVSWPGRWTLIVGFATLVLAIAAASILVRESQATWGQIFAAIGFFLLAIGATMLLAAAAMLSSPEAKWLPAPQLLNVAAWTIGMMTTIAIFAWARRYATFGAAFVASAIVWNVLAIVVAIVLAGASYAFLVPGAALAIAAMLLATGNGNETASAAVCAVVTAIIWFPFGVTLYDALGRGAVLAVALLVGLVATTFAPLFTRVSRGVAVATIVVVIACLAVTRFLPTETEERPRRISLSYYDDGIAPRWISSTPFGDVTDPIRLSPWYGMPQTWSTRTPAVAMRPVPVEVTREGTSIRVRSQRNADRVALIIHATIPVVRVNGVTPPARSARFHSYLAQGWTRVLVHGSDAVVNIDRATPVEVYALDYTVGLPPEGRPLIGQREKSRAFASDSSDATITVKHLTL